MGRRGPQPKGEAYHDLTGTPNWSTAQPESAILPGRPAKPKGVSKDALKVFRKICKQLAQRRALTPGDGEILRLYCVQFDRHMRALAALAVDGEIITTTRVSKGGDTYEVQAASPWLAVAEKAERQMVSILDRLGLNPRAKDAVKRGAPPPPKIKPGETNDPLFL
jgi:P27 family predicted phage terminase small subunit